MENPLSQNLLFLVMVDISAIGPQRVKIVKGRLYFQMACNPENDPSHHYFSVDDDTTLEGKNVYDALYFGPSNQAGICNFCCLVDSMLHSIPEEKKLVLYTTECVGLLEAKKRAHSVFLCATFAICRLKMTAENIYGLLAQHFHYSTLAPYCDMGGKISHNLDMLDCLKAFEFRMKSRRGRKESVTIAQLCASVISVQREANDQAKQVPYEKERGRFLPGSII